MMAIRSIIITLLGMLHVLFVQCTPSSHVFMETQAPLSSRTDLIRNARALPEVTHEVIFVTKERNSEELNRIFHDVSNPDSPNYGKYLTSEQVADLTANLPARDAIVSYLTATAGVEIVKQTLRGEMITAKAAVAVWEKMFHTEFYYYHRVNHDLDNDNEATTTTTSSNTDHHSSSARIFIRAESYSLPEQLHAHVFTVLHTVHMPLPVKKFQQPTPLVASHDQHSVPLQVVHQISGSSQNKDNHVQNTDPSKPPELFTTDVISSLEPTTTITPVTGTINTNILMSAYNVDTYTVKQTSVTNAIFSSIGQGFSPTDLTNFENQFNIPLATVTTVIGAHNTASACIQSANNCVEGNLDVQYIMATARGAATTWWYTDDESFADFFTTVYNTPSPPSVYSISYSVDENNLATSSWSEIKVFDAVVQKLSVQGVTIVAASGDNGINTSSPSKIPSCPANPYVAQFPASSAYVLAVGATQGAESWAANGGNQVNGPFETVCQSDTGGTITSGGGFSGYYTTPTWQTQAVNTYFSNAALAGKTPLSGYKVGFRGYPDVSLNGVNYQYYVGGALYKGSGTSASTPVVAGFITLMNSARLANGLPLLGFVNPLLYNISSNAANYASNFYDITSGINSCYGTSATVGGQLLCCINANKQQYGFSAVAGWDPATGLGTINFKNLKQAVGGLVVPPVLSPTSPTTDTPLYLPVNGVSYADYIKSPIVFKNQVANAVAFVLTLQASQVSVTAVAYNSRRRTRTRVLLGSAGQSVLVQMTVRSDKLSQEVLLSLNNAIGNGLMTTAFTAGNNVPSLCPACILTANVLVSATAVVGTAPTSALTAKPPPSSSSASASITIHGSRLFAVMFVLLMIIYY